MFTGASSFNQPLNNWDVTSATTMAAMFLGAVLFNQPLNNWDVSNVAIMNNMLVGVTLDSEYYDNLLIAWSMLTLQPGVNFHAGNSRYTNVGISARGSIISTYSWIITDLGYHPTPFTSELSSDADAPDDDGSFSLTWTDSYGATNYTVYQYNSLITEINGSLTILLTETASLSLSLIDLANGTYYYAIFSNNEFGSTLSNCIEVEVLTYLYITITNPSGSSEWGLDTAQTMTWNSEGDIANVRIELYKGEAFVMEIISNTANDGEFIWSVPNSLTYADNYRIKIIDASDSDTYDYSENFEIGTAPEEPKKVPGYNLPILIGTIGIMAALLSLKRKKR